MLAPAPAFAQSTDGWEVNLAPLYIWGSRISGDLFINDATVPVSVSFDDALDSLSGIFTLHVEARKGRWGMLSDIGFVGLSTQGQVRVPPVRPGAPGRTVSSDIELENVVFEAGGSYLVSRAREFSVIAGVRTYTMAPTIVFTGDAGQLSPVDVSKTSINAFAGVLFRPKLSERWMLVTRGDIGGGEGFTWSGAAGFQFQATRRMGVLLGYRALGIDTGFVADAAGVPSGTVSTNFDVAHYGPIVALNLRWGAR